MAHDDTAQLGRLSSPLIGDVQKRMAKADLRKAETASADEWRERIGRAVRETRGGLSLKEFTAALNRPGEDRDERQVARWEDGKERPQFDVIFAVPAFRARLVLALAGLVDDVVVETNIRIKRTA